MFINFLNEKPPSGKNNKVSMYYRNWKAILTEIVTQYLQQSTVRGQQLSSALL